MTIQALSAHARFDPFDTCEYREYVPVLNTPDLTFSIHARYIYRYVTVPDAHTRDMHDTGVIISQPKTSFLGVVFDVDHDFEGPRAPKAVSYTHLTLPTNREV